MAVPEGVTVVDHVLLRRLVSILRDRTTPHGVFRQTLDEAARILAYEAMRSLRPEAHQVQTPLEPADGVHLADPVVIVAILRAGLGMVDAVLEMIPTARVWHLGLYRDHQTLEPVSYYNKLPHQPDIDLCLLLDPMLATGGSATAAIEVLKQWGATRIKFLGLIAAPEGVERLAQEHPDVPIHLAALDDRLNEHAYIVPGLGDAGDRQFGTG